MRGTYTSSPQDLLRRSFLERAAMILCNLIFNDKCCLNVPMFTAHADTEGLREELELLSWADC